MGTYTWDEYCELFGGPPEPGDPDCVIDVRERADIARKERRELRTAEDRSNDRMSDVRAANR